ncbi:MAG TPA: hypothetical protein VFR37_12855 [Longimicrobium sp.]|nr:hypothetical protein [Longimicrobium sp.]
MDTFERYLVLLRLSAQSGAVPDAFRLLMASVVERLRGWSEELAVLINAWATQVESGVHE